MQRDVVRLDQEALEEMDPKMYHLREKRRSFCIIAVLSPASVQPITLDTLDTLDTLGRGSFGKVYKAKYTGIRTCAVKLLHDTLFQYQKTSDFTSKFEQECRFLNSIKHPIHSTSLLHENLQLDTNGLGFTLMNSNNPENGPMKKSRCGGVSYNRRLFMFGGHGDAPTQPARSSYSRGYTIELHPFDLLENELHILDFPKVKKLVKESWRIATREVMSESGSLKMKVVKKIRDNYLNVKDKLYEHISPLLKEKLSMSDFEAMNKLKLFGPSYLGKTVKWYNPSALKDIAEAIGCTEDYKHYIEVFHSYISGRVMYNTCSDISVLIDEEWGIVDIKVMDLSDVIDAVKKAVAKKESAIEIVAQKEATEDDEEVVVTVSLQKEKINDSIEIERAAGQNERAEYPPFTQSLIKQGYQLPDRLKTYTRERKSGDQNSSGKAVEPTDQNVKEAKRCHPIRHINLIQIV